MKRFLKMVAILLLIAAYIYPNNLIAEDVVPKPAIPPSFESYIRTYTTQFGSDTDIVYSVGMCESKGKWIGGDFRDGVSHSFGQYQYFQGTWDRYAKKYRETFGVDDQFDIKSMHDQVKLTAWVFSLDEVNKQEWTTYVAISRGGVYKFYSKFHKKWFNVECHLQKLSPEKALI